MALGYWHVSMPCQVCLPPWCVADHVCLATHRHHTWPPPYPQHTYGLKQVQTSQVHACAETTPDHTHKRERTRTAHQHHHVLTTSPCMARLDPSSACAKGPSRPRPIRGSDTRHGGQSKRRIIMPTHTGLVTSAHTQQPTTCAQACLAITEPASRR
jgi:hypothetical protein